MTRASKLIKQLKSDVIFVQESTPLFQLQFLVSLLKEYDYYAVKNKNFEYVGIIYNKNRFEVLSRKEHLLSRKVDKNDSDRIASIITVVDRFDNFKRYQFNSVHLSWRLESERETLLALEKLYLNRDCNNFILGGDFNATPNSWFINEMQKRISLTPANFNNIVSTTCNYDDKVDSVIDYIFVSDTLKVGEVSLCGGQDVSDHYLLTTKLK